MIIKNVHKINAELKEYLTPENDKNKNEELPQNLNTLNKKEDLNLIERRNTRYSYIDNYRNNYIQNKTKSSNTIISLNSRNKFDINENLKNGLQNTNEE